MPLSELFYGLALLCLYSHHGPLDFSTDTRFQILVRSISRIFHHLGSIHNCAQFLSPRDFPHPWALRRKKQGLTLTLPLLESMLTHLFNGSSFWGLRNLDVLAILLLGYKSTLREQAAITDIGYISWPYIATFHAFGRFLPQPNLLWVLAVSYQLHHYLHLRDGKHDSYSEQRDARLFNHALGFFHLCGSCFWHAAHILPHLGDFPLSRETKV